MVKNVKGGSSHKKMARKNVNQPSARTSRLRTSEDELELYAQVTSICGGGICKVLCIDGNERLCVIRKKFKGRGIHNNFVSVGKWVLVGSREFETSNIGTNKTKLDKCDLLEVYSDLDKEKLKNISSVDWKSFIANDNEKMGIKPSTSSQVSEYEDIQFTTSAEEEYEKIIADAVPDKFIVSDSNGCINDNGDDGDTWNSMNDNTIEEEDEYDISQI